MNQEYSDFYNLQGDNFNIEAVCPYYDCENRHAFTWYRDERGIAIISGYDPENDPSIHWLCNCGNFITDGCCHCSDCGAEAPWGCDCGLQDEDYYNEEMDFGYDEDGDYERLYDGYGNYWEPDYEEELAEDV